MPKGSLMSDVLFASVAYAKYDENETLPAKFDRLLEASGLGDKVSGTKVAIKMHVGDGTGTPPSRPSSSSSCRISSAVTAVIASLPIITYSSAIPSVVAIPRLTSVAPSLMFAGISASITIPRKWTTAPSVTWMWRA